MSHPMTNGCYDNRVDYSPVTFNWFLTVYVDTVPTEVRCISVLMVTVIIALCY